MLTHILWYIKLLKILCFVLWLKMKRNFYDSSSRPKYGHSDPEVWWWDRPFYVLQIWSPGNNLQWTSFCLTQSPMHWCSIPSQADTLLRFSSRQSWPPVICFLHILPLHSPTLVVLLYWRLQSIRLLSN